MKTFLSFVLAFSLLTLSAQSSDGFSYTSTIRNSNGQAVGNAIVNLRFTIKLNSTAGTVVYRETQRSQTNSAGLTALTIGKGQASIGIFNNINWTAGTHYLSVEFFTGSTCEWINAGTTEQIVSKCNNVYTYGSCSSLVWSDEFNGTGVVDATKWHHQTKLINGDSWFNGEIQHYTNRQANSNQNNGVLNIVAKKETFTDQNVTKQYTSARLNSKFAFKYGRVEIRAKLPTGVGTWPAIWTLGKNITETGGFWSTTHGTTAWPACGEIDIMEHWGSNQNYVQSAMHTPSSFGNTANLGGQTIPTASSAFHVYTLDWTADKMEFSVDGVKHYTYNPSVKNSSTWPFDKEQYILLNLAIQGNIANNFVEDALVIDYIRIYQ
jgi:beta-glucanase (GH16 family)